MHLNTLLEYLSVTYFKHDENLKYAGNVKMYADVHSCLYAASA